MKIPDGVYQNKDTEIMHFVVNNSKGVIISTMFGEMAAMYKFSIAGDIITMTVLEGNSVGGVMRDRVSVSTSPPPTKFHLQADDATFVYISPLPDNMS